MQPDQTPPDPSFSLFRQLTEVYRENDSLVIEIEYPSLLPYEQRLAFVRSQLFSTLIAI
jgi:hypothetical protein